MVESGYNISQGKTRKLMLKRHLRAKKRRTHKATTNSKHKCKVADNVLNRDFGAEKPNKKWKRLSLGLEVRLMHAYFIKCNEVFYNEDGSVKELHCTYDPDTKSGSGFNERKPNGNIHFVEASTAIPATINLFEPLLIDSDGKKDLFSRLNPNSWQEHKGFVEPSLKETYSLERFQFIRKGYFATDYSTTNDSYVFNRIVELKSSFN